MFPCLLVLPSTCLVSAADGDASLKRAEYESDCGCFLLQTVSSPAWKQSLCCFLSSFHLAKSLSLHSCSRDNRRIGEPPFPSTGRLVIKVGLKNNTSQDKRGKMLRKLGKCPAQAACVVPAVRRMPMLPSTVRATLWMMLGLGHIKLGVCGPCVPGSWRLPSLGLGGVVFAGTGEIKTNHGAQLGSFFGTPLPDTIHFMPPTRIPEPKSTSTRPPFLLTLAMRP